MKRAPRACAKSRIMPTRRSVGSATCTVGWRNWTTAETATRASQELTSKLVLDEINMSRLRNRQSAELHAAVRHQLEIGLVVAVVSGVRGVVPPVVLDAEHQDNNIGVDALPESPHQEVLLIGSVSGNTGIDDSMLRQIASQQVGEAVAGLDIVAPNEGIAEEQDGLFGSAVDLGVTKTEAVMRDSDRARSGKFHARLRDRQPAKLRVVCVGQTVAGSWAVT